MSIFKSLFGKGRKEIPDHKDFKEGDIFYTEKNGKYQAFKLLKIDPVFHTFHTKAFEETSDIPMSNTIDQLTVQVHHFPVSNTGFTHPKFIANQAITDDDLVGYLEYIKQTQNVDEIVKYANQFYKQAHQFSNQKNHLGAIEQYSKAIQLMPNFFEAIDNRAFCYMDLGNWNKAIEGFKESLTVNPNSLLATFTIGECHFKMQNYEKAKSYFLEAQKIDPNHPLPPDFLRKIDLLLNT